MIWTLVGFVDYRLNSKFYNWNIVIDPLELDMLGRCLPSCNRSHGSSSVLYVAKSYLHIHKYIILMNMYIYKHIMYMRMYVRR